MTEFSKVISKLKGHEVTNPRVQKNLELLQALRVATEPVTLNADYKTMGSVKFLNRKGLLKYKAKGEDRIVVYPTLLFYYLTLIIKCDTYDVYKQALKLYEVIGDKLNEVKPE